MPDLERLARNPLALIGLATLAGWLVGSGTFALPFGSHDAAPAPAPATSIPPAPARATTATIAQLHSSSPVDALAGWDI